MKINTVLLSGGSGSRLWPLSRAAYPKQLLRLTSSDTMLQTTLKRARALEEYGFNVPPPILICNQNHRFIVREQAMEINEEYAAVYLEPEGRNTAPAIALAALHLINEKDSNQDSIMLIMPADHSIGNIDAFAKAVESAKFLAEQGYLVTFGVQPTNPETGYGYIRSGNTLNAKDGHIGYTVDEFIEKPQKSVAINLFSSNEYTWNSGIFVFRADIYLKELEIHRPDIFSATRCAWLNRTEDLDFIRPGKLDFLSCPAESIDYAVMQSTRRAAVVPVDMKWSDVGAWESLWNLASKNKDGNSIQGDVFASDTRNSLLRAESRLLAVIGLDDVVVVETPDALLVMHKDKSQNIKEVISHFQNTGRTEHVEHVRTHRPWGWYEGIDSGDRFQVKRIMVKPGEKLSLQMHHHRAEHWIVVSGTAKVTVNDKVILLGENQSTYIPLGHIHRLENPGKIPLHLIEVQSGSYLGEDDIVRLHDTYGRASD